MLECEVVQDLFKMYHDGMCGERTEELVREHLDKCEECKSEYKIFCACMDKAAEKERDIYERGMKMIEKTQKEKTMAKIISVDFLFNLGLLLLSIRFFCELVMQPAFTGEEFRFTVLSYIIVGIVTLLGCEVAYFISRKRGKEAYVAENMSMMSIVLKAGILFFFIVIACVFGVKNIFLLYQAGF